MRDASPKKAEPESSKDESTKNAEERHQDLLARTAAYAQRAPRAGFLELKILQGKELKSCDSCVVVEYKETKDRSEVCKKLSQHRWDYGCCFTMASDLDPVVISVYQVNAIGRSLMGETEFYIPEYEVGGSRTLRLKPKEKGETSNSTSELTSYGLVKVAWSFSVDSTTLPAPPEQREPLKRFFVKLILAKATGITIDRQMLGPCGMGLITLLPSSCQFRLAYRGEFCEMVALSPKQDFAKNMEVNWSVCVLAVPTSPLVLEIIGRGGLQDRVKRVIAKATFNCNHTITGMQKRELVLESPGSIAFSPTGSAQLQPAFPSTTIEPAPTSPTHAEASPTAAEAQSSPVQEASAGASGHFGTMEVSWECFPDTDLNEIIAKGLADAGVGEAEGTSGKSKNLLANW